MHFTGIKKQNKPKISIRVIAGFLILSFVVGMIFFNMPNIDSTYAAPGDLMPGTQAYYDAKFTETRALIGWVAYGTPYTNHLGNPATVAGSLTTMDPKVPEGGGPWKLDLVYTKTKGDGKCSLPWNGATAGTAVPANQTQSGGAYNVTTNPYLVYTAEEYRWCIVNHNSFKLMNDIDLGGQLNQNWTTPAAITKVWTVDGNGRTVYNFYMGSAASTYEISMFGVANNVTIRNLRISNSYTYSISAGTGAVPPGGVHASILISMASDIKIQNCAIENSVVQARGNSSTALFAANGINTNIVIDNSYTKNCLVFSSGCCAQFSASGFSVTTTNSFSIGGTVIGASGHNGGFVTCAYGSTVKNCFIDVDVYGNRDAGGFAGTQHNGTHTIENCYASGKVEGTNTLGGFIGTPDTEDHAGVYQVVSTIKNCYSAAMVGMMSNAQNQGSFMGSHIGANRSIIKDVNYTITDCYGVGEVGSLGVNSKPGRGTDSNTSGGFMGSHYANIKYDHCYYDKQTTAIKEWAIGNTDTVGTYLGGYTSNQCQSLGANFNVKGVLTTDTDKSGTGLTSTPNSHKATGGASTQGFTGFTDNSKWVFEKDHYPQLVVFAQPTTFTNTNWMTQNEMNDLVKAYSRASTSTVKLETWEKRYDGITLLPYSTYDTVRDLTLKYFNTSTSGLSKIYKKTAPVAASASSAYSASYDVSFAIDNDDETYWASVGTELTPWFQVDLGSSKPVDKVNILWPKASVSGDRPTAYKIQLSNNGTTWTDAYTYTGNTGDWNSVNLVGQSARYVRMQVVTKLSPASWIRIYRFEVYALSTTADQINTSWEKDGATSTLWGDTVDVLSLNKTATGEWYCKDFAPGIEWLTVKSKINNQVGQRRLRIVPTAALDAGTGKTLTRGNTFDHADDVRLAYSTGPRMNTDSEDITVGVYPDDPLNAYQQAAQPALSGAVQTAFLNDNDLYKNVYGSHLTKTGTTDNATGSQISVYIYKDVLIDGSTGEVTMGAPVIVDNNKNSGANAGNNQKFNGYDAFNETTDTRYFIEYVWDLADGRYMQNGKMLYIKGSPYTVEINAVMENGTTPSNDLYLDASDMTGPVFGASPRSSDSVSRIAGTQAKTSWEIANTDVAVIKLTLQTTYDDEGHWGTAVSINNPKEGDEITVKRVYQRKVAFDDGTYYTQDVIVDKTYTVMKDPSGYYYLIFTRTDTVSGIKLNDVEDDIKVTLTVKLIITQFEVIKRLTAPAEEEEKFVFQVDFMGNGASPSSTPVRTMYAVITIGVGDDEETALFVDMPVGWYKVIELDSNWRFELLTDRVVTLKAEGNDDVFSYTNGRKDIPWANGNDSVTNEMPPVSAYQ